MVDEWPAALLAGVVPWPPPPPPPCRAFASRLIASTMKTPMSAKARVEKMGAMQGSHSVPAGGAWWGR